MKRVVALLLVLASSPAFARGDLEIVANDGATGAPIGFERSSVHRRATSRAFVFFFGDERMPARALCGSKAIAFGAWGRARPTIKGTWHRDLVDEVCALAID